MSAVPPTPPVAGVQAEAVGRSRWWAAAVLVGAAFAAYANSFNGPFVFDDASSITTNPTIRQLWPLTESLVGPTTNVTAQGRPMLNFSLAVNYALGGTEVWGYHALNLAIHAAAGLVLLGLVRLTLLKRELARPTLLATGVALLWVVHPLQTESVTYIVQRAESLMGLFYLLTLYGFARSVSAEVGRSETLKWQVLAVAACALGMATKEVMATAPLMVLFYDRTFFAGGFGAALRARGRFYAALAGTWLVLGWLVVQGGGNRGGSVGFGAGVDATAYWLTQFKAVGTYLRLTFLPEPLVFEYGTFWITGFGEIAVEVVVVLGLLALTVRGLWRGTATGFLGAWFFGILAPTSLAPGTTQMIVEHRMYLPLAAVLVLVVVGVGRKVVPRYLTTAAAIFTGVAVLATVVTARRNYDYRTDVALWQDTVAKRPANPLAHFMLAGAYERSGDVARALASYEESLRLKPDFSVGRENFGELLLKQGRRTEAVTHFEAALRLQPEFADAHMNLGNALLAEGRGAEALRHLGEAVRLAPGMAEMRFNFANALAAAGRQAEALVEFKAALSRPAGNPAVQVAANYEAANLLAMSGRPAEAVPYYEAALKARPDYAEARHNLGSAFFQLGRLAEAEREYVETLRIAPDFPGARARLEMVRTARRR